MKPCALRCGVRAGALWVVLVGLAASIAPAPARAEITVNLESDAATDACIYDRACLKEAFLRAAFGGDPTQGASGRIVKWSGTIRAAVLGAEGLPEDRHQLSERAFNLAAAISRQAGINLRAARGDPSSPINLIMFVSDDFVRDRDGRFKPVIEQVFRGREEVYDAILNAEAGPVCRGQWYVNEHNAAAGAIAMIESDLPGDVFERCIYSNMLNVLGMPGPLPGELDSILNAAARRSSWTALDFVLLEILYHPLIEPGMTAREVGAVFPRVHADVIRGLG
jgi:hypothetical protein